MRRTGVVICSRELISNRHVVEEPAFQTAAAAGTENKCGVGVRSSVDVRPPTWNDGWGTKGVGVDETRDSGHDF